MAGGARSPLPKVLAPPISVFVSGRLAGVIELHGEAAFETRTTGRLFAEHDVVATASCACV